MCLIRIPSLSLQTYLLSSQCLSALSPKLDWFERILLGIKLFQIKQSWGTCILFFLHPQPQCLNPVLFAVAVMTPFSARQEYSERDPGSCRHNLFPPLHLRREDTPFFQLAENYITSKRTISISIGFSAWNIWRQKTGCCLSVTHVI